MAVVGGAPLGIEAAKVRRRQAGGTHTPKTELFSSALQVLGAAQSVSALILQSLRQTWVDPMTLQM